MASLVYSYWPVFCVAFVLSVVACAFCCFLRWLKGEAARERGFRHSRYVGLIHGRHEQCAICLDSLHFPQKVVVAIACRHAFHLRCFYTWIKSKRDANCPICRSKFPTSSRAAV